MPYIIRPNSPDEKLYPRQEPRSRLGSPVSSAWPSVRTLPPGLEKREVARRFEASTQRVDPSSHEDPFSPRRRSELLAFKGQPSIDPSQPAQPQVADMAIMAVLETPRTTNPLRHPTSS